MKTTFAGHPLHPQLVELPTALFPTSLAMDTMALVTNNKSYENAAYYMMATGTAGAAASGTAGLIDYFSIPSGTETKKIATGHLLMNLGVFGLFGANLLSRRGQSGSRPKFVPFLLSLVGNVGLYASAWLGQHLVYKHGVRVSTASPMEDTRDLKLPADDTLEHVFHRVGEMAPGQVRKAA